MTATAVCKTRNVFAHSNTGIVSSFTTLGRNVFFDACVVLSRQRPCDGLIPRLRSRSKSLKDSEFQINSQYEQAKWLNPYKEEEADCTAIKQSVPSPKGMA
jgi:hypothetical protein